MNKCGDFKWEAALLGYAVYLQVKEQTESFLGWKKYSDFIVDKKTMIGKVERNEIY